MKGLFDVKPQVHWCEFNLDSLYLSWNIDMQCSYHAVRRADLTGLEI